MTSARSVIGSGLVVVVILITGCVPDAAGYDDVRTASRDRLGGDVRWHAQDSDRHWDTETRRLLGRPLTADAAVQVALYNNASLQAAFENLGVARAELVHALRLPNPTVGAALRYHGDQPPEIDLDATLSLSELLFMPFRRGAAEAAFDAEKLEVAGRAADLAFDTRRTFFDYQAAAQRLELRRHVLGTLRASADMAERLHAAGNITELVLASERSFYEEARIAHARAEAASLAARERLNALMGLFGSRAGAWRGTPRLPEPKGLGSLLANAEARAVERSLDLAVSRRRFQAAARRANASRLEGWVPELRAGVSAERQENGWGVGPMAELEVPLFYQGQGDAALAIAEMRRERKKLTDTAVRLRARVRAVAARFSTAAQSLDYYRTTLLPLRKKVLDETQLQYNAMSAGVFQLLEAKRGQMSAAQAYVDLLHEYWTLRSDLEQLLAGRLAGDLMGDAGSVPPDAASRRASEAH